jgi:hypothetical protein
VFVRVLNVSFKRGKAGEAGWRKYFTGVVPYFWIDSSKTECFEYCEKRWPIFAQTKRINLRPFQVSGGSAHKAEKEGIKLPSIKLQKEIRLNFLSTPDRFEIHNPCSQLTILIIELLSSIKLHCLHNYITQYETKYMAFEPSWTFHSKQNARLNGWITPRPLLSNPILFLIT